MLHIEDRFAAYCLDSAVGEFGRALEAELSTVEGKNRKEIEVKSERLLRKWLDMPARYRTPMATRTNTPTQGEEV